MKNMHFQGTRCSWCFQGPVLVQLCVASSKVACVAWVAVSVSDASGRSGASKKRPRKQASINESSCEIRKAQIYKSPKQKNKTTDFESIFSKKWKSVQRRITFLSSVWLYDAFSPGNIGLPPALRGGTSLRQNIGWHFFFPKKAESRVDPWVRAWGAARAARLFIMPRDPPSAKSGVVKKGWMFNRGQVVLIIWLVQERIVEATPTC